MSKFISRTLSSFGDLIVENGGRGFILQMNIAQLLQKEPRAGHNVPEEAGTGSSA